MATSPEPASERLAGLAVAHGRLGIDTEFVSEGRYRPLLCLVQVVVPDPDSADGQLIGLLDPLDSRPSDPAPLALVLADPDVEVVVHAARQDVAILQREWDTEVRGLFDTQVAAAFAGLGAQLGHGALIAGLLDRRAAPTASFTKWDTRPLSADQLAYARDDVLHLLALADALHERLGRSGRLEWAREECRLVEQASGLRDPSEAWRRLPRVGRLSGRQRAVARELAAWRERTAAAEDRPLGSVVGDAQLVEIANRQPGSTDALADIRGLHPPVLRRRGAALLAAVARGRQAEPLIREEGQRPPSGPALSPLVSLCEALVRHRVASAGIAYELVASRAELETLAAAVRSGAREPEVRVLAGWRRELVGEELLALMAGQIELTVKDGALHVAAGDDASP